MPSTYDPPVFDLPLTRAEYHSLLVWLQIECPPDLHRLRSYMDSQWQTILAREAACTNYRRHTR